MSPGLTTERVYAVLKAQIMEGERPPGERLDPAKLAHELNASATPVRDALHQLLGERMVQAWPGQGFQVPLPGETALRDLYGWNGDLVALLLRSWMPARVPPSPLLDHGEDSAHQAAALFDTIAATLGSPEHRRALRQASERLHRARKAEAGIFGDLAREHGDLAGAWAAGSAAALRSATARYHRRRQGAVAQIAARLVGPVMGGNI
jgi:DNA-binding transcriptional MocR family regulator